MERYKCILDYPSGPSKGSIVYSGHQEKAYQDFKYKLKDERNIKNYIFFTDQEIENYPLNWKKLKNKNHEKPRRNKKNYSRIR